MVAPLLENHHLSIVRVAPRCIWYLRVGLLPSLNNAQALLANTYYQTHLNFKSNLSKILHIFYLIFS